MKNYQKLKLARAIHEAVPQPLLNITEQDIKKFKTFSHVLLATVAAAGVCTLALAAPNALQLLHKFMKMKGRRPNHVMKEKKLVKAFYYLKGKGFVHMEPADGGWKIVLSEKGKTRLEDLNKKAPRITKPEAWDGKFWQVAADIPSRLRLEADMFRRKIKAIGFYPLQRTLWYFPFDPRKVIEEIADSYRILPYVTVMKVDLFDPQDQKVIFEHFQALHMV